MAAVDEYDITFSGLRYPGTGDSVVTLSHGVSPSVFTVTVARGQGANARRGDVRITHNGRDVIRPLEDCAIAGVVAADGSTYTVRILDRRHRWKNGGGVVNGWYNRRNARGEVISDTYRSPRELAHILLVERLKERSPDLSGIPLNIPRDATPEARWDHARPHEALAQLVDALGCRVVLGTDNRIHIARLGTGRQLPSAMVMDGDSETLENTDTPEAIACYANYTRWQGYLSLEPVGQDLDGSIKPIDDLSYKPESGWYTTSIYQPETAVTFGKDDAERKQAKRLAQQCILRWYRIAGQADRKLEVKGYGGKVDKLWQYLPLPEPVLFDTAEDESGNFSELPAFVEGQWYDADLRGANTPFIRMDETPSIDRANGIVRFNRPIFRINPEGKYEEAAIWLYTTYHVHDLETRIADRWSLEQRFNRGTAGPMPFFVDDIERRVRLEYDRKPGKGPKYKRHADNLEELEEAARYYIRAKELELIPQLGRIRPLAGFHDISPDGAIQQVTWSLSGGLATTIASRNTEHALYVPPYSMRRRMERIDAATRPTSAGRSR